MTVAELHRGPAEVEEVTIDEVEVRFNGAVLERLATARALSSTEMSILIYLTSVMEERTGLVRLTREELAKRFNVLPTFMSKATTKLRKLGLIWRLDGRGVIRVNPEFAFRGESREEWVKALEGLPEDAPTIRVPVYRVAPPKKTSNSSERHLKAI